MRQPPRGITAGARGAATGAPDRRATFPAVTPAAARAWYARQPWIVGCNYVPRTAANQLEMWQAETWRPDVIDEELAWAAALGLNAVRVFLHDLPWRDDPAGFPARVDAFLALCERHGLRAVPVLFDDCWGDDPRTGPQPRPRPGVHNSAWVQSPGTRAAADRAQWPRLEAYVRGVARRYRDDARVLMWDVYNEVTNFFLPHLNRRQPLRAALLAATMARRRLGANPTLDLARAAFGWLREEGVSQPLTAASWYDEPWLNERLYAWSDVVTFHHYGDRPSLEREIRGLLARGRPVLCTEWLSRGPAGSEVATHLPAFREHGVGCFHWGLVDGRTQTKYGWGDRGGEAGGEPDVWFHDLLHADGTPYRPGEARMFRELTAAHPASTSA